MKKVEGARATHAAGQSIKSTWRAVPRDQQRPVTISDGFLEKEKVLDEALDRYCELMDEGNAPPPQEYCKQFPDYRHSLARLIDVEVAMADEPALDEDLELAWPKPMQEFLGYEIIHELGVGAFARVYLAAEQSLGGRLVAIKVSPYGSDEAKTLAKLRHPNIVPVFSVQREELTDMTAVCMPYHGSTTLGDMLEVAFKDDKPPLAADVILQVPQDREPVVGFVDRSLSEHEVDPKLKRSRYVDGVATLGIQMAEALAYTHECGILHRDLKPSNVLLTPSGVPMLLDFNLASDIESGAARLGGTLPYMPPEQIRDAHLQPMQSDAPGDPRSDVFSLGVILYELLTGKLPSGDPPPTMLPREASTKYLEYQQTRPVPIAKINPQVSPSLARTIDRCLSLDLNRRPKSAVHLGKQLKRHFSWGALLNRYRVLFLVLIVIAMLATTAHLRSAANKDSDYVVFMRLAIDAIEAKDFKNAIEHCNAAEEAEGMATVPVLLARGYCSLEMGKRPIAVTELEQASNLSRDPFAADCYAYAAALMGNYVAAETTYQKTNVRDPNVALRYVSLAYCKLTKGPEKSRYAIPELDKAILNDPTCQIAYPLRANARRDSLHPVHRPITDAVQDIEKALKLGPPYFELHYDAAKTYSIAATNGVAFMEPLKQQLISAVNCGRSRQLLEGTKEFEPWLQRSWFIEIIADAPDFQNAKPRTLLMMQSLLRPSAQDVANWLSKGELVARR